VIIDNLNIGGPVAVQKTNAPLLLLIFTNYNFAFGISAGALPFTHNHISQLISNYPQPLIIGNYTLLFCRDFL
tara:strand:- start:45 stop:263 length:219 start_codon:yes stop_codon:yes gene_type:complete